MSPGIEERLPCPPRNYAVLAVVSIAAAAANPTALALVPLVALLLAPLEIPVAEKRVYRPKPDRLGELLFNAEEPFFEEPVVDVPIRVNVGSLLVALSPLLLSRDPAEALAVFIAVLPVAYLATVPAASVGPTLTPAVGLLPAAVAALLGSPEAAMAGAAGILVSLALFLTGDELQKRAAPSFSIGGRGSFEAVMLVALSALLLA